MSQSELPGRRPRYRYGPPPRRPALPWSKIGQDLLTWIFPVSCVGCRRTLDHPPPLGLCIRCRGRLKGLAGRRCPICSGELDGGGSATALCESCRDRPPTFERLLAGWSYEPPLDAVVRGLKFHRLDYLGQPLGAALAEQLGPALDGFDVVTPVPLHWRRQWRRGFNQAEEIARGLARFRRTPLRRLLLRRRATHAQSELPRPQRLENPRHAFRCRGGIDLDGMAVLLIDDVATTGATLDAAAHCLYAAGANRVVAVAVGRTPAPSRTPGGTFLTI